MKMSKIVSLVIVVVMLLSCLASCGLFNKNKEPNLFEGLEGTYDITLWVSEKDGVADQFKEQIAAFCAAHPGIVINASIEGVTEADAGSKVIADVSTAPDMYCFAQDQLARLVQAAALAEPVELIGNQIKESNDKASVSAASVAGTLYAYPMTSDNGYYLYYDTSIISNPDSMEDIIAACEANGKTFRYALENAWYTASFFFATGCHSNWTMNEEGKFNSIDDTFNSPEGLVAMKGMQKLAQSKCYDSNADIFTNAGAIVTGIWNADAAEEHFGENLGATDLPSFTVDGKSYHLGSYSGNKLIGVKPQTDSKKALLLSLLAQYLTGAECQTQRFETFQWGPSNLTAQQSDAVQANKSLAALAAQSNYAQPQGNIDGSWWDIAKVLGAKAKAATTDAELQAALDAYDEAIDGVLSMDEAALMQWAIIGGVKGTTWDTDIALHEVSTGVWESDAIALNAGEEFKLRRGGKWAPQVGLANAETGGEGYYVKIDGGADPSNIVVEATGTYVIRFEWDGTSNSANITFNAVEE
jgi:arabinogalactan oligomer/maltooligosaccharide transport system substrate-binding protein